MYRGRSVFVHQVGAIQHNGLSRKTALSHGSRPARCFLVSHAHLDHIAGLALTASTLGKRCDVYGARQCLDTVEKLFSGELWPRLASWDGDDSHPLTLRE